MTPQIAVAAALLTLAPTMNSLATPNDNLFRALLVVSHVIDQAEFAAACDMRSGTWVMSVTGSLVNAIVGLDPATLKAALVPPDQINSFAIGVVMGEAAVAQSKTNTSKIAEVCKSISKDPGWKAYLSDADKFVK